jgi:hypothetical protein
MTICKVSFIINNNKTFLKLSQKSVGTDKQDCFESKEETAKKVVKIIKFMDALK